VLKNGGKRGGERAIFKNEVKKLNVVEQRDKPNTTISLSGGKIPDFTRQRVFHETSQETSVASVSKLLRQPREELHRYLTTCV
jgi:hypothetical protein